MKFLVICFSHTGNNRVLAKAIAWHLGCGLCEIKETRRRREFTMILDLLFGRTPKIEPLGADIESCDHVVLTAPVWASQVAHPMQALLRRERERLPNYSFVTLCGYVRPGQHEKLEAQLSKIVGRPPRAVQELPVCELLPLPQRKRVRTVSGYRVKASELGFFEDRIASFLKRIRAS